ncbi:hypothetical protein RchiOBHm_Chr5g0040691 [Rosa chinensis]|uniref:Transcription factor WD40-like family n=1 Tax=Rosa chinensis TaxID=74649 RepID=A0A2P6QCK8_ROSCH|nr:hypothetical protein RchiOBHm_Chr5g0040691 [Rosa chinensis]
MFIYLMKSFFPTNHHGLKILQASPPIRFNKEGILLAVSTNDNGIKILANLYGIRLLRTVDASSCFCGCCEGLNNRNIWIV